MQVLVFYREVHTSRRCLGPEHRGRYTRAPFFVRFLPFRRSTTRWRGGGWGRGMNNRPRCFQDAEHNRMLRRTTRFSLGSLATEPFSTRADQCPLLVQ